MGKPRISGAQSGRSQTRSTQFSRARILAGTMALMLISGALQAFSVFALPLSQFRGWQVADVMTSFGIASIMTPICMILAGRFLKHGIAAPLMLGGGSIFGLGYFLSSFATTTPIFLLCAGVIVGFGQGLMYAAALTNSMRFFSDKRGVAAGLTTASMAAGSLIIAPVSHALITNFNPAHALRILGTVYVIVAILAVVTCIRSYPMDDEKLRYATQKIANEEQRSATKNMDDGEAGTFAPRAMIRTSLFAIIFAMFLCMSFSEVLVLSNLSPMVQGVGVSAQTASLIVALFAVINGASRILCGQLSDRFGIIACLNVVILIETLALLGMAFTESRATPFAFVVLSLVMAIPFGAVMSLFAPLTMNIFGHRHHGTNYGIMFCAFAVGSFLSSRFGALVAASHGGSYATVLYLGCGIAFIAAVLSFVLRWKMARK